AGGELPPLPSSAFPPRPSLPGLPSPAFPPRPCLPGLPSPAFPPRPCLPGLPSPALSPWPSLPAFPPGLVSLITGGNFLCCWQSVRTGALPFAPSLRLHANVASLPRISPFSLPDSPFPLSLLCPVDMTLVQATMHRTLITIRTRYIECGDDFSGGPQQHLGAFLAMLSKSRKVTVDGVDKEGRPRKHSFELHEEALTGYSKTPDDLQSCLDVCRRHAKSTLSHLQSRLGDLDSLNGVRLFMPDTYPDDKERRAEECLEHFETLVDLFHACERANILPGKHI
ncbi:unnamed protein product, partial [Closterium sp. NIES-64]